jgi:cation diffusion facilitator CzcD-associated flavoprotein CzcO
MGMVGTHREARKGTSAKPIAKGMRRMSDPAGKPLACIIGAGYRQSLADRGLPFECFEKSGKIGGLWTFGDGNSAAYRSLCLNVARSQRLPRFRDAAGFP